MSFGASENAVVLYLGLLAGAVSALSNLAVALNI